MNSPQEKIISSPCVLAEAEQGEEIIFSWGRPAKVSKHPVRVSQQYIDFYIQIY